MNKDNTNRVLSEKDLKECISSLDLTDNQLAVGLVDETVLVLSHSSEGLQQEEQPLFKFKDNCLGVVDVKYDPHGKLLAVSCLDSTVRVYNTEEGALFSQVQPAPMENFKLAFHERHLVSAGEMGKVSLYDIETQEVVDSYKAGDAFVLSLDCSQNGNHLALGNALGHVFFIDTQNKQCSSLECHGKQVRGVRFTCDSNKTISCSDDMHLNVIDVAAKQLMLTLTGHKSNVNSVDTHPTDPNVFVTASYDRTVKLWDLRVNSAQQTISSHNDNVWAAKFLPGGNVVASGGENGQLFLHSLL